MSRFWKRIEVEVVNIFKSIGNSGVKAGKFVGRNVKNGVVHLYQNKDEILLNLKDKIEKEMKAQEKRNRNNTSSSSNSSMKSFKDRVERERKSQERRNK